YTAVTIYPCFYFNITLTTEIYTLSLHDALPICGVATDDSLIIEPENGALTKVLKEIDEWKNGESEEHSVAIYGDKGSGKSTILRSEEHTSELQSRENLVCRLLLEKKK